MIRISDIFKKAKENEDNEKIVEESPPKSVRKKISPKPVKPKAVEKVVPPETKADKEQKPRVEEPRKEEPETSGVRISSLMGKKSKTASGKETLNIYEETMSLMRETLKKDIDYESIDASRIIAQVEKVIEQLVLGNENMLMLAFIKDSRDENYLLCHSVNVCIFSIEIGLGLGYEKSKLIDLGVSAILHDIGMVEYMYLVKHPRKLTPKEYEEIKKHPIKGSEILEKINGLNKVALYVAHQHHERIDGSGYPRGLKEEFINEYAMIVSLVDGYEAMMNMRVYRDEFLPLEALREILDNKKAFANKLIKILIDRIGIFCVGSMVELNTKEIAQVVKINRRVSMRPVVKVIYEANGKEPKETKILDLTDHHNVYITKGLPKKTLEILVRETEEWKY
ncbi:MAG: HD domain-containing phosphohydrolase [bacterium]